MGGKGFYRKCMSSEEVATAYFAPFMNFFSIEMLWAVEELVQRLTNRLYFGSSCCMFSSYTDSCWKLGINNRKIVAFYFHFKHFPLTKVEIRQWVGRPLLCFAVAQILTLVKCPLLYCYKKNKLQKVFPQKTSCFGNKCVPRSATAENAVVLRLLPEGNCQFWNPTSCHWQELLSHVNETM